MTILNQKNPIVIGTYDADNNVDFSGSDNMRCIIAEQLQIIEIPDFIYPTTSEIGLRVSKNIFSIVGEIKIFNDGSDVVVERLLGQTILNNRYLLLDSSKVVLGQVAYIQYMYN